MSLNKDKPSVFDRLAAFVYPSSCFCCGCNTPMCTYVCDDCKAALDKLKTKRAKAVSYYGQGFVIHFVFSYKDEASSAVKMLKFTFSPDGAKPMGDYLAVKAKRLKVRDFDLVAAVPMTAKKKAKRGYNQAELIAKQLAKRLDVKFDNRCIKKIRETSEQHTLSGLDRRVNIRGAYFASDTVKDKHILLVDDVVTTGSTLCECAACLINAGARHVTLMTFVATKYSN